MFKVNNKDTKISKYVFFRDLEATELQNESTLLHMLNLYLTKIISIGNSDF